MLRIIISQFAFFVINSVFKGVITAVFNADDFFFCFQNIPFIQLRIYSNFSAGESVLDAAVIIFNAECRCFLARFSKRNGCLLRGQLYFCSLFPFLTSRRTIFYCRIYKSSLRILGFINHK